MKIKFLLSVLIIIVVLFFIFTSLRNLVKDISYDAYENECETDYHYASNRNIVLRIDDIQASYLVDVQKKMINDALDRDKTLSLAVIPLGLNNNKAMVKFLKEKKCKLEIGLHGYENNDFEFSELSYEEADKKIKDGLKVLNEIESEVITFIPPNNEISNESKIAVYGNKIKIISSGFYNREFGYSVSTYDWENHSFMDYKEILSECLNELEKNETCIVMMHPQDYVTDGKFDNEKYQQYIQLLDNVDKLNATIVTFRDLYYKDAVRVG